MDKVTKKRLKLFFRKLAEKNEKTFIEFLYLKAGQAIQLEKLLGPHSWHELMLCVEETRLNRLKPLTDKSNEARGHIEAIALKARNLVTRDKLESSGPKRRPGKKTLHNLNLKLEAINKKRD